MFTTVSLTGTGIVVYLLSFVLNWLGVNADTSQVAAWADSIVALVGMVMLIVGQARRKDVSGFLWKV